MSQSGDELNAGISIFVEMSSQLGLVCIPTPSFGAGRPVRFDLSKGNKHVRITLGYDFVTDLPGTKQFQSALDFYLSEVALRFGDPTFEEYGTLSGVPVEFRIRFPFRMSTEGGSFEVVHVLTKTGTDRVFEAKFSIHLTDVVAITTDVASFDSVITEPLVVNAVRQFIDTKQAVFYPEGEHPVELQIVTIDSSDYDYKAKRFVYHRATDEEITEFLKRKVYWLGFRRGSQTTRVCIADLYDAAYLGISKQRLQQAGAILAANGFVEIDSSGLYANAGAKLLQEARGLDKEYASFFRTESPKEESVTLPSETATPEGSLFLDVFISHATEDKTYVEPLVKALEAAGIHVWFDKSTLEWGDDLRSSIDRGLANCRYGIVVFSKAFLQKKKWTEYELNSLFALEQPGRKIILPIWHAITHHDFLQYSAGFADRLAMISSKDSYEDIVERLLALLGRSKLQKSAVANGPASIVTEPAQAKPNAVAQVDNKTGENAPRAETYSDDLERQTRQVVGHLMTFSGQQLLRQLLIHGTFRSTQLILDEISMDTQNEQMNVAKKAGIVKQQPGTPAVAGGYYTINPQFLEALKKVLYEELAKHQ